MIRELLGVVAAMAAIMGGWFLLQALSRRVCHSGRDEDVFGQLAHGCGACEGGGACGRKSGERGEQCHSRES